MVIQVLARIFGDEWFPISNEEESQVVGAIADALDYLAFRALNPIERMWVAIGAYCVPRYVTLLRWWANRTQNKFGRMKSANTGEAPKKAPAPETQPSNEPQPQFDSAQ